jgi:flagellar hook-associated protein 1 FlgK
MPVSTFTGLQTSLRGLLAQQRSIDVTGHNIANASTPGFSRQEAVLATTDALQIQTGAGLPGQLGAGVDVASYRRIRDGFLDAQFRAQSMRLGYQTTTAATLANAELALAEPSEEGLGAQLAGFWDSWADVANAPEDPAARQALVEQGGTVALTLRSIDEQIAALQAQGRTEYATLTGPGGQVDAVAREIAMLNGSISAAVQSGDTPNDLLDRRDFLVDQLSALAQVSVTAQDDGTITVSFGDAGTALVEGRAVTWPQSLATPGGRLGALKALSDPGGTLDTYRKDLSAAARTLADSVNAVHGAPAFFSYTAGAEASTLDVAVTRDQIRTSATASPGANDLAIRLAGLRGGAADASYRTFVTGLGTDAAEAQRQEANAQALTDAVDDRRQSVAGVSLDEEMTNLVRFQRAYQASARAMSTMDEMIDQLINRTGRVGL